MKSQGEEACLRGLSVLEWVAEVKRREKGGWRGPCLEPLAQGALVTQAGVFALAWEGSAGYDGGLGGKGTAQGHSTQLWAGAGSNSARGGGGLHAWELPGTPA